MKRQEITEEKQLQEDKRLAAEQVLHGIDYAGTKIAEGRATREEYAAEIALADEMAAAKEAATTRIAELDAMMPDEEGYVPEDVEV